MCTPEINQNENELSREQLKNVVGGSAKAASSCEHKNYTFTGTFVDANNQFYYVYKCNDCGFVFSKTQSGGATGSW